MNPQAVSLTPRGVTRPVDSDKRSIGGLASFAIVSGSMLGIGIFLAPGEVAAGVTSPLSFLALWLFGGVISLAGAVAYAELGAAFPEAGGDYVFQKRAFGPSVAFASGWALFAAIFCGAIATMSVGIFKFQVSALFEVDMSMIVFGLPLFGDVTRAQVCGVGLIALVTGLNLLGAKPPSVMQTLLTLVPVLCLTLLALFAFSEPAAPAPPAAAMTAAAHSPISGLLHGFLAVYFAYSGWNNIVCVAGEVRKPEKNIPRALVVGTVAVTVLYLCLTGAFLWVLGLDGIRSAGDSGGALAGALLGGPGRLTLLFLVLLALLASVNAAILGGARVASAMAANAAAPSGISKLSRRGVPARGLCLQGGLSMLIALSGRFGQLLSMVSMTMVFTGAVTVASLFVLRRRLPEVGRPYLATGYPFLPGLYLLASGVVITLQLSQALGGGQNAWYPLLGLCAWCAAWALHRSLTRTPAVRI